MLIDLFALLMLAFVVKHYVADIPLQTTWMALNKGTFMHPGGIVHAGIHAAATLAMFQIFISYGQLNWSWLWIKICIAEFVIHYTIDWCKMNFDHRMNFSHVVKDENGNLQGRMITSTYYYWSLVGDQCLHFATYIAMAYIVVKYGF